MTNARIRLYVGIAFALAIFARVAFCAFTGFNRPPKPGSDQAGFDQYAWNLVQGKGYFGSSADVDHDHPTSFQAPGITIVYATLFTIFGHTFWPLRVVQVILDSTTAVLLFFIGRKLFDERVALLTCLVYAVYLHAIYYTSELLSEPLAGFLTCLFMIACLRAAEESDSGRWLTAAGVLLGLCILTRPNLALLVPFWALWILQTFWKRWRWHYPLALLVAIVTVSPWSIRNYLVHHKFVPLTTQAGSTFLGSNNRIVATDPKYYGFNYWDANIPEYKAALKAPNEEIERDRVARQLAIDWLKNNPDKWGYLLQAKFRRFWTPFLQQDNRTNRLLMLFMWTPILVFFAPTFFVTFVQFWKRQPAGLLLHYLICMQMVVTLMFSATVRYRFTVEPFCILLAAAGLLWVVNRIIGKNADAARVAEDLKTTA